MDGRDRRSATAGLTRAELEAVKEQLAQLDADLCRLFTPPQGTSQPTPLEPPTAGADGTASRSTGSQSAEG